MTNSNNLQIIASHITCDFDLISSFENENDVKAFIQNLPKECQQLLETESNVLRDLMTTESELFNQFDKLMGEYDIKNSLKLSDAVQLPVISQQYLNALYEENDLSSCNAEEDLEIFLKCLITKRMQMIQTLESS